MQTNNQLENLITEQISVPHQEHFSNLDSSHPPRILLLYGSLRQRSFSRLVVEESARLLKHMGAEVRIFNPEVYRSLTLQMNRIRRCKNYVI